ncbi:MAG: hypothetical protein LQ351_005495 [Letrouitia transgressa]|nr:MAG: hypothetical protein LQ351_005495 [Letrouitia transgressa]
MSCCNTSEPAPIIVSPSQAWDGNDGPWSTFVLGIGTPPQYVRVLISTTCSQPWAVDPLGCTQADPLDCASTRGGLFAANKSSTWDDEGLFDLHQQLNLGYSGNGHFGFDSIALGYPGSGAITIEHQILTTIATKDFYIANWGIAPRPTNLTTINSNNSHQSLLSTLKESSQIPSLSYGYTAGARYRLKKVTSSLVLGGFDESRFVPHNITFNFADDSSRDLVVGLQSILISDSSSSLLSSPVLSFVDASVSHIWLPLDACRAFENAFGLLWDKTSGLYLVNDTLHDSLMARNPTVSFRLASDRTSAQAIDITLPYASFDLQLSDTYPNVNHSTRYFPIRRAANDTQYTLGRVFLQEAYLIVDYERTEFSIHQCRFHEDSDPIIRTIHSTNTTKFNVPLNSQKDHANRNLSPGAIGGILVAALMTVTIGALIYWGCHRRRVVSAQSSEPSKAPDYIEPTIPELQEHSDPLWKIGGQPRPIPELHGKCLLYTAHYKSEQM